MSWFLYLIECADGSVYTGITTDVAARFDEHAAGKGARYTRSRKPRAVLASFPLADRSSALRAEYWVKQLSPKQKRELAAGTRTLESVLPVVVEVGAGAEEAAESAGGARKRANGGTRRGRPAVADAMSADMPVITAADTGGSNGTSPKRGRTAAKKIATPPGAAADSKAAAPKRSRAAAKTSPPDAGTAAKAKSTRRTASKKNDATPPVATAPAPKTKKTARAKQNRAAS
ncbi:GIY-YIG nuclease family protein [Burkholderia sp. Bp9125]|nr:GIY-YIG nuclease family protein [Burkholderia sp. Bp9125]